MLTLNVGERRSLLLAAGKYYALAGATHAVLLILADLRSVRIAFFRAAWEIGPYRSVPIPYDYSAWYRIDTSTEILPTVGILIVMAWGLTLAVAALHATVFAVTVVAHAWLGRPRYWKDVRPRLNLGEAWVTSAKRSWGIWPAGQAVWLLMDQLYWGFQYALFPIIQYGAVYSIANGLVIAGGFSIRASGVLRNEVIQALRPEDVRCHRCEYRLRGIESARCPECGTERDPTGGRRYGVGRTLTARSDLRARMLRASLAVGLLLAPVWVPLIMLCVPRPWLRHVPAAFAPNWQIISRNPNAFPINLDVVCIIRHDKELAILRLSKGTATRARYDAEYWS